MAHLSDAVQKNQFKSAQIVVSTLRKSNESKIRNKMKAYNKKENEYKIRKRKMKKDYVSIYIFISLFNVSFFLPNYRNKQN